MERERKEDREELREELREECREEGRDLENERERRGYNSRSIRAASRANYSRFMEVLRASCFKNAATLRF